MDILYTWIYCTVPIKYTFPNHAKQIKRYIISKCYKVNIKKASLYNTYNISITQNIMEKWIKMGLNNY